MNKKKGMTLIELAIVIVVSSLVILPLAYIGIAMTRTQKNILEMQDAHGTATYIMNTYDRYLPISQGVSITNYTTYSRLYIYLPYKYPANNADRVRVYIFGPNYGVISYRNTMRLDLRIGGVWRIHHKFATNIYDCSFQRLDTDGNPDTNGPICKVAFNVKRTDLDFNVSRAFLMRNY